MSRKIKMIICLFLILCMAMSVTACSKKCENGCGQVANPDCMAGMCDDCCAYWMGLNGCYRDH